MATKRKRSTRKATKINYRTVSCGHTKGKAQKEVKTLHSKGYTAKKKKGANGQGWCVLKGRKRKSAK